LIGFYSTWPFFVCIALLLAIASTPLFKAADTPPGLSNKRIATMDGMRGFLALAVVFHHAAIYHRFLSDRVWIGPPSHFLNLLGPVGVALFFMITGFLFWSQLIRSGGRPSWISLYTGRLFRIGPLYLAAVALVLAIVAERTGLRLRVPAPSLLEELVRWLSLGVLPGPNVNGYAETGLLLADVTWTLQWEWYFYLSLPILALFARRKGMHLRFVLVALVACQAYLHLYRGGPYKPAIGSAMLFLLGMLSASLSQEGRLVRLPDAGSSTLLVVLLVLVFQFDQPSVSSVSQLMLGAILYLVISGSSLFGLLKTRPAIRLGDVSYGIYLLQGLALGLIFRTSFSRRHDLGSPFDHWMLCLACAVLLVGVATATHVWIERPGILVGKRVATALRRRWEH